jgi:sec-independent protein translocase protein TatC
MALRLLKLTSSSAFGDNEKRAELTEHLAELRSRLLRSALYLVAGCIVVYACFHPVFHFVASPVVTALQQEAHRHPGQYQIIPPGTFVFHQFFGPFLLRVQLSLYGGLILGSPFVVGELWGFVAPGLTVAERRPVRMIAPFSILLFVLGASLAFWIMPAAVAWFLSYLSDFPGAILLQDPSDYVVFLFKMILIFGLMFQLPIVMIGLGKLGIIRSAMLAKYWQYIVVGLAILAMVVVPSNDPLSMIVMAVPLEILFLISIWLVKLVEPKGN